MIVVIAILAALATVAFNGIQVRAENTKTINGVTSVVKTEKAYHAAKGTYPVSGFYPCIGPVGTVCGVTPAGNCWNIGYVGAIEAFNNELKTINTSIPEVSKQSMECHSSGSKATGAFYYSVDSSTYVVYYFLKGNVDCSTPGGAKITRAFSVDTTVCAVWA